ncbi:MAG: DUF2878 domain-containing protein [Usitatibacteraceae bacterium]
MHASGLTTFLAFNLVWLTCAIGAAQGSNNVGVTSAIAFVLAALWARDWPRADTGLVVVSGMVGAIVETMLAQSGLVHYGAPILGNGIAPPWIVALWLAFGVTISTSTKLLGKRASWKAAALGLVFGPLAYAGGQKLGALAIKGDPVRAPSAIAIVWAISFPALVMLHATLCRAKSAGS